MKYTKPSLTIEQQADRLLERGLVADRAQLVGILSEISYYRLSGYLFPYRNTDGKSFKSGTQFSVVFEQYLFDRQLRVLVIDAIERIEVSVKAKLVNLCTEKFGAFAHIDRSHFPGMTLESHRKLMDKIHQTTDRSKEAFIQHYFETYTSETEVPLWMAAEIMDFGAMFTLFKHLEQYHKRDIAMEYGLSAKILESWLMTLNYIRNLCAHHGRLWNRVISIKPYMPDKKNRPEFHLPESIRNERMFAVLSLLRYMLQCIAPQSQWPTRVTKLWTEKHQSIPIHSMGIPSNWKEYDLWH